LTCSDQTALAPSSVKSADFGQIFPPELDGQTFGQPLVSNNTLLATTANNNANGFDPVYGHKLATGGRPRGWLERSDMPNPIHALRLFD